ncbi:GDSL-type esterase/lipase family protein [Rhabdobacter roseus]|uniref:GDSL-type esterase/lipase family protein n=1 Tax=Rhabdobacter roseus TaxID=1655419 RepID=UPI00161E3B3B|nr:GDSL-type esterase/lipase family protein [Rhabdobacter roseus]
MKKSLLILFLTLLESTLRAQPVAWDSIYRPDIYGPQVELFKARPHSRKDIVFLGNSLTFWADWSELLGSRRYKNRGIPGDTSFGVLARLDEVIRGRPTKVFLLIGINDLARRIPDSVIVQNYRRIVRALKAGTPSTQIYVQTLLPTNDAFGKLKGHYHHEPSIRYLNGALKEIAQQEQVGYIDLHPHFIDEAGKLKKEYTWDGVHLTLAGYTRWADLLYRGKYLKRRRLTL